MNEGKRQALQIHADIESERAPSIEDLIWHVNDVAYVNDVVRGGYHPAIIIKLHTLKDGRPVADVEFDNGRFSRHHFTWSLHNDPQP